MQTRVHSVAQMVSNAKQHTENLTPDELAEEMAQRPLMLVDIREPGERAQTGSIPGAVHAVRGMLEFYADPTSAYHRPEFNPEQRTVLFCASGGRSALAVQALTELGYTRVAHLDGGVNAWIASGRQLSEA